MPAASADKRIAATWGLLAMTILGGLIVVGSRNLDHFDAALVGYTFATLFATFGITYRYAMWLRRPPTRMYWKRGWSVFLTPRYIGTNLVEGLRQFFLAFAANRFIFRRGRMRGAAHWLIMWGCVLAAAITFPLVWGWIHFETVPGRLDLYQTYVFGFPLNVFAVESIFGFVIFHGLVWSALLVIAGVMLAFRRRMVDHAAVTLQLFAQDIMPLVLLFAISDRADADRELHVDEGLRVRLPRDPARDHGDRHPVVSAVRKTVPHLSTAGADRRQLLQGRGHARRTGALPAVRSAVCVGHDGQGSDDG
jgi:hypothetical protein